MRGMVGGDFCRISSNELVQWRCLIEGGASVMLFVIAGT